MSIENNEPILQDENTLILAPKKVFTSKSKEYVKEYNKKRYQRQKNMLDNAAKNDYDLRCEYCQYDAKTQWNMKMHLISRKHYKNLALTVIGEINQDVIVIGNQAIRIKENI